MDTKYLIKSKFKLAIECPTKLYYSDKSEYSNLKSDDSFLQALAESGFQVSELAKQYFSGGETIESLDVEEAIEATATLLERDKVIIYEAAFKYENLLIRADILIKDNEHLTLIEVKSKSISSEDKVPFFSSRGEKRILIKWEPYILDVAFQKYVITRSQPKYNISTYLLLVDKDSACPSKGLNQKFRITKDEQGRVKIIVNGELTEEEKSKKILKKVNVAEEINFIFNDMKFRNGTNFSDYIKFISDHYEKGMKISPILGSCCRKCEFKLNSKNTKLNLKSGFDECWREVCSLEENEATILDIWNLNFTKVDSLIEEGRVKLNQLIDEDINPKSDQKPGLSASQRQWMQVEKVKNNDNQDYIDIENLRSEMASWTYPLHFIDFETAMPAIPFNKGERPFLGLAFQFSHHILFEDGTVKHFSQFLNSEIGINPNIEFIRALKLSLERIDGTIFRYSNHENTYLNLIHTLLQKSEEPISDKEELLEFIERITQPTEENKHLRKPGPRNMVDLWVLVKRFYYDPMTKGSNSIKKVLPAILSRSKFLRDKYSQPIYGVESGIKSLNFTNQVWIQKENDVIKDPYEILPPLFYGLDLDEEQIELLFNDEKLKEGGAASIAYSRMQFESMSDKERKELTEGLLRYCELDTLAMVMIVEAWKDMIFQHD